MFRKNWAISSIKGSTDPLQVGVRYRNQGVRVLGAAWTEFSANYAHIIRAEGFSFISVGVGMRYNLGHSAGAFQFTDLDYTVVDTAQLIIHDGTARYGVAQPAVRAGSGWGSMEWLTSAPWMRRMAISPIKGHLAAHPYAIVTASVFH